METLEKSIEIAVPAQVAYNQWTQLEDFPQFMEGVMEVTQLDDTHIHWRAKIAGKEKEWTAEITEQIPDSRIAWRSTSGAPNAGVVTFNSTGTNSTRVTLQMDYEPEGLAENIGDAVGLLERKVSGNLERFKDFIETRQSATGAWRGEVHQGQPRPPTR